ncbi:hypothetical protein MKW98_016170 [Papaver atlanticum]|uniref:Uncharacterized protein n=1 Tax=Papaver atlanticum TaxID=357466 RepID=A0AAD4S217_9MAGN|nr:hypothetical protein MKW98_016170 [Papaver atlanticum]
MRSKNLILKDPFMFFDYLDAFSLYSKVLTSEPDTKMPTAVKVIRVFNHPENMVEKGEVSRPMNLIVHILFSDKEAFLRKLYSQVPEDGSLASMYNAVRCMSGGMSGGPGGSKLFIGGLSYNTDDQQLKAAFL